MEFRGLQLRRIFKWVSHRKLILVTYYCNIVPIPHCRVAVSPFPTKNSTMSIKLQLKILRADFVV